MKFSTTRRRGSGTTAMQMRDCAQSAIYVWVNGQLDYPKRLALHLGRSDLRIVSPSFLSNYQFAGLRMTDLVLDHACELNSMELYGYQAARISIHAYQGATRGKL